MKWNSIRVLGLAVIAMAVSSGCFTVGMHGGAHHSSPAPGEMNTMAGAPGEPTLPDPHSESTDLATPSMASTKHHAAAENEAPTGAMWRRTGVVLGAIGMAVMMLIMMVP